MSEPTIWDIAMGGKPPEKFVPYEEYKKLETENARLKADVNELADGLKLASEVGIKMADEVTRLKAEVERLTERLGGVRLIVTEEMYDELNTKYLEQQHELQNIALTARQILDEKIDLKEQVERLTKQNALATPRHLIASQDIKTLREQIEELKLENSQYEEHHKYGQNVITSLREEVERLTKASQGAVKYVDHTMALTRQSMEHHKQVSRLEAQVERLTKAGDAMAEQLDGLSFDSVWDFWNAAKEGKGQP
jgi:DNA repair exonuclease SbcCD ATPase subunit